MKYTTLSATQFTVSALGLAISSAIAAQSPAEMNVRTATSAVSADQLVRAQQRFSTVNSIADRFSAEFVRGADSAIDPQRVQLVNDLMRGDAQGLVDTSRAINLQDALSTASAAALRRSTTTVTAETNSDGSAKSLGDATQDLVYTPIMPCRVVDTRKPEAQPAISGGTSRDFNANTGLGQGGGSCVTFTGVIPAAFALNVTVDTLSQGLGDPAIYGFVTIWPQGQPRTLTSWMNSTGSQDIANFGIATVNQSNGFFSVYVQNTSNIVVDAFGYFRPPTGSTTGATGATGATGGAGAVGVAGATGAIGATGAVGVTGAIGAIGVSGTTGPNGATGSVILSGNALPTTQGGNGDYYIDDSIGILFGPKTGGTWVGANQLSLIGPIGATGATGAAGGMSFMSSASAAPVTTVLGGLVGISPVMPVSGNELVSVPNATLIGANVDLSSLLGVAETFPQSGTFNTIKGSFVVTVAVSLAATVTVTAELYKAPAGSLIATPTGLICSVTYTGVVGVLVPAVCTPSGSATVTAGDQGIIVVSATAVPGLATSIVLSPSIGISP